MYSNGGHYGGNPNNNFVEGNRLATSNGNGYYTTVANDRQGSSTNLLRKKSSYRASTGSINKAGAGGNSLNTMINHSETLQKMQMT